MTQQSEVYAAPPRKYTQSTHHICGAGHLALPVTLGERCTCSSRSIGLHSQVQSDMASRRLAVTRCTDFSDDDMTPTVCPQSEPPRPGAQEQWRHPHVKVNTSHVAEPPKVLDGSRDQCGTKAAVVGAWRTSEQGIMLPGWPWKRPAGRRERACANRKTMNTDDVRTTWGRKVAQAGVLAPPSPVSSCKATVILPSAPP